jgi:exopolysaccharide biosynthesis polyprenyl glycosylphosphotransferase
MDDQITAASLGLAPVKLTRSYFEEEVSFRWMYMADGLGLFTLMVLITTVRFGPDWPLFSRQSYLIGFMVATIVHLAVLYFGGLYDREHRLGNPSRLARVSSMTAIAVLIDAGISLGANKFLMPRLNLAIFAVLASLLLAFNRWLAQSVRTARFGRPRVLLIGSPDDVSLAESHLDDSDKDAIVAGRRSSIDDLGKAVEESGATDVLLLSGAELASIYPEPLGSLELKKIGLYHRLAPEDTLLGVSKTRQIAGMPFIALRTHALPQSKAHFKRILDLVYVVVALPVLLVVMALVLLYARLVAGRPIFYTQERVGRYGKPFTMVKLRTMYPGSEDETGPILAEVDDLRVIPAMRWLRATRLDELPQLWNVIKGDMSLVGPRPERPELSEQFEMILPGYGRRHDIRPGITGLAQVHGRYHTDPGYKLGHDLQYLVNWSPVFDLQILLKTVVVVLTRQI